MRGYLARNANSLPEPYEEIAASLRRLAAEAELHYSDLESLEQRLTVLEEKMIGAARASRTEEQLLESRRELGQPLERQLGGPFARQARLNDDGVGPIFLHRGERGFELLIVADPNSADRRCGGRAAELDLLEERFGEGIGDIGESGHATGRRQHVADQLHTLASEFRGYARDPGDIATGARKARDEARTDRIPGLRHDDRVRGGRRNGSVG